ncbi:unnamed protein product [Vitrella brassicaformis CCMP3155]|uniref:Uncharacterized protein n=1 Tax=Vitrella brassicaformis (strain CCMP3155) TaxID=1169540 RepID=A0A0G4FHP7_VITBC|nr:unnamed protein product [Vitrella brassicaformis CCMP3155]|eukprot:CEM12839.1 unnamed protein product [Vitrella brassicaformis CCMP3155]
MNNMRGVVANDRQGSLRQSDKAMLAQQAQKLDAALAETERAIQANENYLTNDENKKRQYATAALNFHAIATALGSEGFKLNRVTGHSNLDNSNVMAAVRGGGRHNDVVVIIWPQTAIA